MENSKINDHDKQSNRQSGQYIECGAEKETVDHYLLNCELYDEEREELRKKVGAQSMRSSQLLGDEQIIKKTVDYIEKTGRFKLDQR